MNKLNWTLICGVILKAALILPIEAGIFLYTVYNWGEQLSNVVGFQRIETWQKMLHQIMES